MAFSGWQLASAAALAGAGAGGLFWILARLALPMAGLLPSLPAFADNQLASPGNAERLAHRQSGRELAVLLAALSTALIAGVMAWALLRAWTPPGIPDWGWALAWLPLAGMLGVAGWFTWQAVQTRRQLAFAWAAKAAVGNILKRLNLAGNAVFHGVATEASTIDHVVIGRKGVFALNVVARPAPKDADGKPAAELRNGKLWMAGNVESLPVGDAARNMTLLSGALSKLVGHRVPVRSVLVVPGWHTVPNGEGNHLVLNESNLAMLTSWNTPDAYLMDEDCVSIHAYLHKASRVTRLA